MGEPRYFVRASVDAPIKGPFDRDSIRKSLDRGLMKPEAEARIDDAEGTEEWVALKTLFKPEIDEKRHKAEGAEFERAVALQNLLRGHERKEGGANLVVGVIMIVAGLGLTAASMSAGRGGGVLFVGLVVFGIVRIIRGAAVR